MPEILAFEKFYELSAFQERLQLYSSHVMSHEIMKHIERLITLVVSLCG
jgi:hypothetical protein